MMGATHPQSPGLIEGVGDEVVLAVSTVIAVSLLTLVFVLYRRGQQPGIHPDFAANIESMRRQMNHHSNGASTSSTRTNRSQSQGSRVNTGRLTCPVCLGEAAYAVETNCGHAFCGRCIMTYWQYQTWQGAVPCPSCRTRVTLLLPTFTVEELAQTTGPGAQIMQEVNSYNRRFSGEPRSIRDYIQDLPTLLRHAWSEFFTVGGLVLMFRVRIILIFIVALVYFISPLDIIPEAVFGILGFLDDFVFILLLAIYISIIYRRYVASRATGAAT